MPTLQDLLAQFTSLGGGGQPAANPNPFAGSGISGTSTPAPQEWLTQLPGAGGGDKPPTNTNANATGFGMNIGTGELGLQGLNSLSGIYGAMKSNKLAQDSFKLNKQMSNTNLNNQIKSYNTALEDKGRARAQFEGQDASTAQAYIDKNRLTR
jgi:hypothetical protein